MEQKSMFASLFKKKDSAQNDARSIAAKLYAAALENTRKEVFYTRHGVPDTFDGRFDLLLVHLFIILHHTVGKDKYDTLSQALFDVSFKDMDQTLREMGIGDMGIPKHMKRMMKAFNGRMHHYQVAIAPESLNGHDIEGLENVTLEEALRRNLFGTISDEEGFSDTYCAQMAQFIRENIKAHTPHIDDILDGRQVITFTDV